MSNDKECHTRTHFFYTILQIFIYGSHVVKHLKICDFFYKIAQIIAHTYVTIIKNLIIVDAWQMKQKKNRQTTTNNDVNFVGKA